MNNEVTETAGLNRFYGKVYGFMAVGVGISALISYLCLNFFWWETVRFINNFPLGFMGLWLIQIVLVMVLSAKAQKNPSLAIGGFVAYSSLMGILLAITLSVYDLGSVTSAFVSAAAMFVGLSIFGVVTKKDLSGIGRAAIGALFGIIIATLLNVFLLHSAPVDFFVSIIGVLVFAGLTAYDNQNIRNIYYQTNGTANSGVAVFLALQLYLDFINLFLYLLRIFGRKD